MLRDHGSACPWMTSPRSSRGRCGPMSPDRACTRLRSAPARPSCCFTATASRGRTCCPSRASWHPRSRRSRPICRARGKQPAARADDPRVAGGGTGSWLEANGLSRAAVVANSMGCQVVTELAAADRSRSGRWSWSGRRSIQHGEPRGIRSSPRCETSPRSPVPGRAGGARRGERRPESVGIDCPDRSRGPDRGTIAADRAAHGRRPRRAGRIRQPRLVRACRCVVTEGTGSSSSPASPTRSTTRVPTSSPSSSASSSSRKPSMHRPSSRGASSMGTCPQASHTSRDAAAAAAIPPRCGPGPGGRVLPRRVASAPEPRAAPPAGRASRRTPSPARARTAPSGARRPRPSETPRECRRARRAGEQPVPERCTARDPGRCHEDEPPRPLAPARGEVGDDEPSERVTCKVDSFERGRIEPPPEPCGQLRPAHASPESRQIDEMNPTSLSKRRATATTSARNRRARARAPAVGRYPSPCTGPADRPPRPRAHPSVALQRYVRVRGRLTSRRRWSSLRPWNRARAWC